jgi:membrane protein DedA with SNARE-associated domain
MDFLQHTSYLGIIVVLVLTGMGLPIPEEVPIIAAGIASSDGSLNVWRAFAACLVGALLGDTVLYTIGYHFGHNLAKKHPRFAQLLHAEREAQIEEMLRKHGLKVFFVTRFMVGIRAPVYLTAGILRMSFRRFIVVDAICATAVVGLFFGLSFLFGDSIKKWVRNSEYLLTIVVVLVVIGVLLFVWRRARRAAKQAEATSGDAATEAQKEPVEM